jgi:Lrp/AsnC family leucine-responsive transcriptional regulator
MLDALDLKVLRHLMAQARMTWAELAAQLGLSPPAAADRVRKLEERGVIQGYAARVNPQSLGYDLTAFVAVTLTHSRDDRRSVPWDHRADFLAQINACAEIQECHHITGEDDYLLKVRCQGTQGLERLITDHLKAIPGVVKTRTTIVLSTVKETTALPV